MAKTKVNIEISEKTLIEALRRVPPERRAEIIRKITDHEELEFRWVKAEELDKVRGLVCVGGNAVEDAERLYNDSGSH
jgi:hypothetical protein